MAENVNMDELEDISIKLLPWYLFFQIVYFNLIVFGIAGFNPAVLYIKSLLGLKRWALVLFFVCCIAAYIFVQSIGIDLLFKSAVMFMVVMFFLFILGYVTPSLIKKVFSLNKKILGFLSVFWLLMFASTFYFIYAGFPLAIKSGGDSPLIVMQIIFSTFSTVGLFYYGTDALITSLYLTKQQRLLFGQGMMSGICTSLDLFSIIGLPETVKSNKSRKYIIFLFFVSFFFYACVSMLGYGLITDIKAPLESAMGICTDENKTIGCIKNILEYSIVLKFSIGTTIFIICILLARYFRKCAQQKSILSLEELRDTDTRAPVLFLRSFNNDQIELNKPSRNLMGRLYDVGNLNHNLDTLILQELSSAGPVVALGNPVDKWPPFGAALAYLNHSNWKQKTTILAKQAKIIVLCIDNTAGVNWEVEHIINNNYLHKTIFIVPPNINKSMLNENAVIQMIANAIGVVLNDHINKNDIESRKSVAAFTISANHEVTCFLSSYLSIISYLLLLRVFKSTISMPKYA